MSNKIKFNIQGMTCVVCANTCQKAIAKLGGVKSCNVNFASGVAIVEYDDTTTEKDIFSAVSKDGYKAVAINQESKGENIGVLIAMLVLSFLLLAYAMLGMLGVKYPSAISAEDSPIVFTVIQLVLCIPVVIMGLPFYIRGFKNLFKAKPNMDSLVAVSTTTAFVYSFVNFILICMGDMHKVHSLYFESVAVIIAIISLGKFLEGKSLKKTGDAIRALTMLTPAYATVLRDGQWVQVDSSEVKQGDVVLVKAGESFCCDGVISEGESNVNESMLTGESMPVDKGVGDRVFGGTINGSGIIKFTADSVGEETKLSKIIRLVEEAQNSKAPIARIADKVSGIFVPAVMCIAILAGIIWWIANGFAMSLKIFVSVLVIACPCALGLATPTAIITGIGRGAKGGILFKNAEGLERLGSVNTVVFDKTGTITKGHPTLTDKFILGDEDQILAYVRAVESVSEHPIAKAIIESISPNDLQAEVKVLSGYGLDGTVEGSKVLCGNMALMRANGIDVSQVEAKADEYSMQGKSIVIVAKDGKAVGVLGVADTLKDDSKKSIEELRNLGLRVILLSGDNQKSAEHIAQTAGIDEVIANVLPEQKGEVIDRLIVEGAKVAMVGDGVNDAPALAKSNVGIAMGGGSDIAIESGQVVIVGGQISGVVRGIRLARATMRNIKQNLFWAFIYNIIGIPIACGVLYPLNGYTMSPMLGGLAMSLSSVSVVANALRLNLFKFDKNKKDSACDGVSCPVMSKEDNSLQDLTQKTQQITTQNEVEKRRENMQIKVNGMMCAHCESRINKAVGALDGVFFVSADHSKGIVEVEFDKDKVTVEQIKMAIVDQDYEVLL
ncbi:MAG: heavy metal translocating P-type ATPase [Clostridia bacterium]|nr:heavy metal translocating P-type ATPase [Clostridia bacterium]